jgi:hypothetical protein
MMQVKVQTVPGYAKGLSDGLPKLVQQEGVGALYKGIAPLWGRQIPYTMMKFGKCDPRQGPLVQGSQQAFNMVAGNYSSCCLHRH